MSLAALSRNRVGRAAAAVWVMAVALAGCGPTPPPTGTVSGLITYKGQPVTAGTVTFRNDDKGLVAGMRLDSEGRYELRYAGGKKIPVGDYGVVISPPEPYLPNAAELATAAASADAAPPPVASPVIPKRYRSPQTSGLNFTVNPGPNTFDLDMNDAAKDREAAVR